MAICSGLNCALPARREQLAAPARIGHSAVNPRRAFTLVELLVVIAVISLLISILLPAAGRARRTAKLAICTSNMRQTATSLVSYAADFKNAMAGFSWKPGQRRSSFADLNTATNFQVSHANQAVDIARRLSNHQNDGFYAAFNSRIVNRHFSHLPMIDGGYFSSRLPELSVACPEDRDVLVWQQNFSTTTGGTEFTGEPEPEAPAGFKRIRPLWSTYQFVPTAWTPDTGPGVLTQAVGAPGYHFLYNAAAAASRGFGGRSISEVAFPSAKVSHFDIFDRHSYRRWLWYAYPDAKMPLAFFDGSVSIRRTGDANPGWDPLRPTSNATTLYEYYPVGSDPPTLSGAISDIVTGYYRWTRGGLKGVDYGSSEVRR